MINFYILTSDDSTPIENTTNLNSGNVISEEIINSLITIKKPEYNYIFISNDSEYFGRFATAGNSEQNTITVVNDLNACSFNGKILQNVLLNIDDLDLFFRNYRFIVNNTAGFIEFKFNDSLEYDMNKLDSAMSEIIDDLAELEKNGLAPIIKNLNSYRIKEKFNQFGETNFFVDTKGTIYFHPSFYYQQISDGVAGKISDFSLDDERFFHFTKPHILCLNCETFFCDRNIFMNKIKTSEFNVPSKQTCELTTLLSKHSKKLFSKIWGRNLSISNLDKVEDFNIENEYGNLKVNNCECNQIKEINFCHRVLYK